MDTCMWQTPTRITSGGLRVQACSCSISARRPYAGTLPPRDLNKHIDRDAPLASIPNDVNRRSLAFPMDMVISADGTTLYVAAFGSSKVGVFSTEELEN